MNKCQACWGGGIVIKSTACGKPSQPSQPQSLWNYPQSPARSNYHEGGTKLLLASLIPHAIRPLFLHLMLDEACLRTGAAFWQRLKTILPACLKWGVCFKVASLSLLLLLLKNSKAFSVWSKSSHLCFDNGKVFLLLSLWILLKVA